MPHGPSLRRLLAGALLCAALAACSSAGSPASFEERVRRFRATHFECDPDNFRQPCQIGPDGRLYEYLPGEQRR